MAVVSPVVNISTGTSGVVITSSQNWNALMYALSSEKTKMESMLVWSDNAGQLTQPFSLVNVDPNGNDQVKVITPKVDAYQRVSQIDFKTIGFEGGDFQLNGNNRIDYTILPNTNTRLVVFIKDDTSVTSQFLKDNKIVSDFPKVLEDIGVELNFMNVQTWKEELPVKQKPVLKMPQIVQVDYLTKFQDKNNQSADASDDYMSDIMSNSIDSIMENTRFEEQIDACLEEDEDIDPTEESEEEVLNADSNKVESVESWGKRNFLKPVGITLGIIALVVIANIIIKSRAKGTS